MNKKDLSERDICTKFITPAIQAAGWESHLYREEVKLTKGRVIVHGQLATRVQNPLAQGGPKRADYVFYGLPNIPLAVLEAKRSIFEVGQGMPQALDYAEMLDAPFAISSNGDGFQRSTPLSADEVASRRMAASMIECAVASATSKRASMSSATESADAP